MQLVSDASSDGQQEALRISASEALKGIWIHILHPGDPVKRGLEDVSKRNNLLKDFWNVFILVVFDDAPSVRSVMQSCLNDIFDFLAQFNEVEMLGKSIIYHTMLQRDICISYTTVLRCIWVLYVRVTRARYRLRTNTYINPYTPKHLGMSDIYSVASYCYFGGTFRMAHLESGWFCLNADDFIECSCPDYSNYPKCKENCPPPK